MTEFYSHVPTRLEFPRIHLSKKVHRMCIHPRLTLFLFHILNCRPFYCLHSKLSWKTECKLHFKQNKHVKCTRLRISTNPNEARHGKLLRETEDRIHGMSVDGVELIFWWNCSLFLMAAYCHMHGVRRQFGS